VIGSALVQGMFDAYEKTNGSEAQFAGEWLTKVRVALDA
jgi:hypothetical protein